SLSSVDGLIWRVCNGGCGSGLRAVTFVIGPMVSAIEPGVLALSALFPWLPLHSGTAFRELARRHGDYALAGVAAVVTRDGPARVACIGVGPTPITVDVTAEVAAGEWKAAAQAVRERTEPEDDIHATAAYRHHLVGVLAEQALRDAAREAAHA